jgi:hypothetical protein
MGIADGKHQNYTAGPHFTTGASPTQSGTLDKKRSRPLVGSRDFPFSKDYRTLSRPITRTRRFILMMLNLKLSPLS